MFDIKFNKNIYVEGLWNGEAKIYDTIYGLTLTKHNGIYEMNLVTDSDDMIESQSLRESYNANYRQLQSEVVAYIKANKEMFK